MVRTLPLVMALLIAIGAIALPSPVVSPVDAVALEADAMSAEDVARVGDVQVATGVPGLITGDIVPGSVGQASVNLSATYDAYLKISWGPRTIWVDSTATIRNTSGGPIDRVELNTIAARLGAIRLQPVTVDGAVVAASRSDQTIVVPLGGILPPDGVARIRVRYGATVRSSLTGSNWLFTRTNGIMDLYRWLPWVSRNVAFDRPMNPATFDAEGLGRAELDVVDVGAIPDGLEDGVGEAQRKEVLDDLLAQEMIDPIDIVFVERTGDVGVEDAR